MTNNPIDSKRAGIRNEKLVLSLLRQQGPLSQVEICNMAGLSSSTASYIVGRLREKGLIIEKRGRSKKRGAKPIIVSINPTGSYVIGVEVNPSRLYVGLFDFQCNLIESIRIPTGEDLSPQSVVINLEMNLRGLLSKHNIDSEKLLGIGVTVSGSVNKEGVVELSSPLGWKAVPLKKLLEDRLEGNVKIFTTRVRLLAEIALDPELTYQNVLYLNIADGVGGHCIIDGNLAHGATNRSGELGHVVVERDGPQCGCGHKGCLEAIVGGPALAKHILKDIAAGRDTILRNRVGEHDDPESIVSAWGNAISENDPYATELLNMVTDYLSRAAAVAINCYDPDVVIISGYVARQCGQKLISDIRQRIETDVFDNTARSIHIKAAQAGIEGLIRGAASAIIQQQMNID